MHHSSGAKAGRIVPSHARLPDQSVQRDAPEDSLGQGSVVPRPARNLFGAGRKRPQRHCRESWGQVAVRHQAAI